MAPSTTLATAPSASPIPPSQTILHSTTALTPELLAVPSPTRAAALSASPIPLSQIIPQGPGAPSPAPAPATSPSPIPPSQTILQPYTAAARAAAPSTSTTPTTPGLPSSFPILHSLTILQTTVPKAVAPLITMEPSSASPIPPSQIIPQLPQAPSAGVDSLLTPSSPMALVYNLMLVGLPALITLLLQVLIHGLPRLVGHLLILASCKTMADQPKVLPYFLAVWPLGLAMQP